VPDLFTFNVRASDGSDREIIINRYENVFAADEKYKRCCGRIMGPNRNHAPTCWTQRPQNQKQPRTPGSLNSQRAAGAMVEEGKLRPGEYVLPAHENTTRDAYAKAVFKAQPLLCMAWAQSRRKKHEYPTALLPPGVQCEQR